MIWPPPATWKSIMHRPLETAGPWDRYESAQLLSFINSLCTLFPLSVFVYLPLTHSLFHFSLALCCPCNLCVLVSLESTVIFKSNQTLNHLLCVGVLYVLVWKWVCRWATVWRGLRETAIRQEGVCSPLQRCLCTLSQRGECHWTDDTHTQTSVRSECSCGKVILLATGE